MAKTPAKRTTTNTPHLLGTPEPNEPIVRLTIELPASLVKHYEEQAQAWDRTPEFEIAERLKRCKTHVSTSPLYFTDDQRRELEQALGHNIQSPDVALAQLKNAVTLTVDEIKVELSPRLQQRIKSRVFRGESYASVVRREIVKALEVFSGIRPA